MGSNQVYTFMGEPLFVVLLFTGEFSEIRQGGMAVGHVSHPAPVLKGHCARKIQATTQGELACRGF